MVVPSKISDNTLNYAAKYRSKARIPALSYMHWHNAVSKNIFFLQKKKKVYSSFTFFIRQQLQEVVSRLLGLNRHGLFKMRN